MCLYKLKFLNDSCAVLATARKVERFLNEAWKMLSSLTEQLFGLPILSSMAYGNISSSQIVSAAEFLSKSITIQCHQEYTFFNQGSSLSGLEMYPFWWFPDSYPLFWLQYGKLNSPPFPPFTQENFLCCPRIVWKTLIYNFGSGLDISSTHTSALFA